MAHDRPSGEEEGRLRPDRINEIFLAIPSAEARELFARVREAAAAADVLYQDDDGANHVVPIMIRPRIMMREQEQYFHRVCCELNGAIEQLARLYVDDDRARALLPFSEREDAWLREIWARVATQPQTVLARLDANADFADPEWRSQFHFFETNAVGIGGMYYAPKVDEIMMSVIVPAIRRLAPNLGVRAQTDMRELFIEQITAHARAIGRRGRTTAFLQERDLVGGPNEFPHLVEHLRQRDIPAVIADPRELRWERDELFVGDLPIDIVYRDGEIAMLLEMEDAGDDLSAAKRAFLENRVVSSIVGELDHKSVFEVLTTPAFASHFTQAQREVIADHVLWTRIVRETTTTDMSGEDIDLVPWLRRNKDRLVLKPNRSYGGYGIVVGPHVDLAQWDDAIAAALSPAAAETGGVVAQRYVDVRVKDFPVLGDDGAITLEEFYVVCGFLATASGIGVLGRASKRRVVNVGQKGGLTGMLVLSSER